MERAAFVPCPTVHAPLVDVTTARPRRRYVVAAGSAQARRTAALSVGPPVKDLFAQDVGVAGVLRQLTQHLQLQRPDPAVTTAVDDRVEAQGSHRAPRPFTSPAMGGLHRSDRVVLGQREGLGRGGGDADLGVGATADRLVEPDAFDVRDVLDQTEQRRLRRDQPKPGFLLGETVEGVVERRPILVQQFIEARPEFRGPRIALVRRCSDRPSTLPTSSRRAASDHAAPTFCWRGRCRQSGLDEPPRRRLAVNVRFGDGGQRRSQAPRRPQAQVADGSRRA